MARKAATNWIAVKQDFISDSTATYTSMARKYNVSARSVMRWAVKEGWVATRKDIGDKVTQKVSAKAISDMDEVNDRHTKAYKNLQAFALTNLNILYDHIRSEVDSAKQANKKLNPRDIYSSQMAKFLAETLRIAMDGERITRGLPTVVTKGEQDVKLSSEFADRPLEDLERLFKVVDGPDDTTG